MNLVNMMRGVLVSDREMADFFEEVLKSTKFAKKACNWVIGDVSAYLNKNNLSFKNILVQVKT